MIASFAGEYRWLSNFHPVPIEYEGIVYPSVENAYQAHKTLNEFARENLAAVSPSEAKKLGRKLEMRPDWEEVKLILMELFLRIKFQNPELALALRATAGRELVEGNWWNDTFWGVCRGVGENHLGKLLMKIRAEMING